MSGEVGNHRCYHEEEIVILKEHVKDIGCDVKLVKKSLVGNGEPGLKTRMALAEKAIGNMNTLIRIMATTVIGATVIALFKYILTGGIA